MKITLNTYEAADILLNNENGIWTRAGSLAMVRYLEDLEEDLGEEINLDVVAIGCDYTEFESLVEWAENYFGMNTDWRGKIGVDGYDDVDDAIRSHIQDHGQLIEFDGGIIVSSF